MPTYEGRILSIDGDMFTAELIPGNGGMPFCADFDVAALPSDRPLAVGDVFFAPEMRLHELGVWTQAEVDAIRARAEEQLAVLLDLSD